MENQINTLLGSLALLGIIVIGVSLLVYDMYQERKNKD